MRGLIVEDNRHFRKKIRKILGDEFIVDDASTFDEGKNLLQTHKYDFGIFDINLNGNNEGLELLQYAKKEEGFHSIVLTDYDKDDFIKKAYSLGADHFLTKNECEHILSYIVTRVKTQFDQKYLENLIREKFITQDLKLITIIKSLPDRLTIDKSPVLLLGESGVGKGALANFIHFLINRDEKKFIALNMGSIAENLVESELFGFAKGSFSGAHESRIGKFELANQGTLFLDEIGNAKLDLQQKMLKAIEEKVFYPVGSNKLASSNFQLISATSENLCQKIEDRLFRADLFFRLNSVTIQIPPLRDRKDDIPLLIKHFLKKSVRKVFIDEEAIAYLKNYYWPGNVRELKSVIEYLMISQKGIITKEDLPLEILKNDFKKKVLNEEGNFFSKELEEYLKANGLTALKRRIELEAVKKILIETKMDVYEMSKVFQLSYGGTYKLYERHKSSL